MHEWWYECVVCVWVCFALEMGLCFVLRFLLELFLIYCHKWGVLKMGGPWENCACFVGFNLKFDSEYIKNPPVLFPPQNIAGFCWKKLLNAWMICHYCREYDNVFGNAGIRRSRKFPSVVFVEKFFTCRSRSIQVVWYGYLQSCALLNWIYFRFRCGTGKLKCHRFLTTFCYI